MEDVEPIWAWRKMQFQMHQRKERVLQVAEAAGAPQRGRRNLVFAEHREKKAGEEWQGFGCIYNQIVKGLESEVDEWAVHVADPGFLSRRMG